MIQASLHGSGLTKVPIQFKDPHMVAKLLSRRHQALPCGVGRTVIDDNQFPWVSIILQSMVYAIH